MDFYETFKPEADVLAKFLSETVSELSDRLPKVQKRLDDEKDNSVSLSERIAKLKDLADISLSSDQNTFESYRSKMRKLTTDQEISASMIQSLETEILPKKQNELQDAERNLRIILAAYLQKCKLIANERIADLFRQCINERQDFLDAFTRIYADCGLVFIASEEDCPGVWSGREVHDLRIRLGMDLITDAVEAPATAALSTQDELKPPEPPVTTAEAEVGLPGASAMPIVEAVLTGAV